MVTNNLTAVIEVALIGDTLSDSLLYNEIIIFYVEGFTVTFYSLLVLLSG